MYELVHHNHPALPGCALLRFRGKGGAIPVHLHTVWCVAAVTHGQRTFTLGTSEHSMGAGWVAFIPPGLPHACSSAPDQRFEGLSLCLSPELVAKAIGHEVPAGDGRCFHDATLHARLVQGHDRLLAAGSAEVAELHAGAMIRGVFSAAGPLPTVASTSDSLPQPVRAALDVLDDRPQDALSLAALARRVRISPFHLARTFARRVGVPPHVYQTLARLRLARKQLKAGMTLAETALACGFYDQSHLCLRFKHYMGVTPGQFQRSSH